MRFYTHPHQYSCMQKTSPKGLARCTYRLESGSIS
jgi:hypothetical protein